VPYYEYEVRDKNGKLARRRAPAQNRQELVGALQKDGLVIISVRQTAIIAERYRRKLHRKAKTRDLTLFAKEFAILIENGVAIDEALEVVLKEVESRDLSDALKGVKKDLEGGFTFRDSIARYPNMFGTFWRDMIDAGEVSGQLPFVMRQIESFLKSSEDLKKKVINALIYPALLLSVSVIAISVFLLKIIPIFKGLFATFGSKLPAYTQIVLDISDVVRKYFASIALAVIVMVIVFKYILSTQTGRRVFENAFMRIPVAGGLFLALSIQKFSSTLGVLLESGIPIIKALEVSGKTSESLIFSKNIEEVKAKVMAGVAFSEALQQSGLFPPIAVQLVLVGEKTGNFGGMLNEVSKYYTEVVDTAVTRFTALMEPLVLMFMAVIIGSLLIAMFLPIFKLASGGR